jgi:hypothetical protein
MANLQRGPRWTPENARTRSAPTLGRDDVAMDDARRALERMRVRLEELRRERKAKPPTRAR